MSTFESALNAESLKSSEKGSASNGGIEEALKHIRDDLNSIRRNDNAVGAEMNKVQIVCEPPPITPPCQPIELPPNREAVTSAMNDMNKTNRELQADLDALQPSSNSYGGRFSIDFRTLSTQVHSLDAEISKLTQMTRTTDPDNPQYDQQGISSETARIDELARKADKTALQMEKDLD